MNESYGSEEYRMGAREKAAEYLKENQERLKDLTDFGKILTAAALAEMAVFPDLDQKHAAIYLGFGAGLALMGGILGLRTKEYMGPTETADSVIGGEK